MSLLKTPWYTTVELFVSANASNFVNFLDQPNLTTLLDQEIKIMGIEIYTPEVLTNAPSGAVISPIAELRKAVLTINNDDQQRIYQIPLLSLNRTQSDDGAGLLTPSQWDLALFDRITKVAWTKSKVDFTQPPAGPYSFLFGIHYDKIQGEKTV